MSENWASEEDLAQIIDDLGFDWEGLAHANIFMTGGTGFIGRWLLETLCAANNSLKLDVSVTILTRDLAACFKKMPHLCAQSAFRFIEGDVESFDYPAGAYTHIIHAATDASAALNEHNPTKMFDVIVQGTRRALNFAAEKKVSRFLFLSSGAIYGVQPWDVERVREDWLGAPDCALAVNSYAEGKRAAEMLCAIYAKQYDLKISTARIFALLGPGLPLDSHFAAGNFIRNAINKEKIVIKGNGKPVRSYLYPTDLVVALISLLVRGPAGRAFNVGSPEGVSIAELAARISGLLGDVGFEVLGKDDRGWNAGRYVPDISRLQQELDLRPKISLDECILRTARSNGWVK